MRGNTEPEAFALQKMRWELFATLTLRTGYRSRAQSIKNVFSWLRYVAAGGGRPFTRLLWVLRFEFAPMTSRGHYHLCLAGLPNASLTQDSITRLQLRWASSGIAEVALYDHARDGVGYILKRGPAFEKNGCGEDNVCGDSGDDCEPMLSKSLFLALRRGRM